MHDEQQTEPIICSDNRTTPRGKPFRSKLLPFVAEIAKWQREGKTYGQMASLLREKHGLHVHPDTINSFVLVRVRARKKPILPASFLREIAPPVPTAAKVTLTAPQSAPRPIVAKGSKVIASNGQEIVNAQYAPVNPNDL